MILSHKVHYLCIMDNSRRRLSFLKKFYVDKNTIFMLGNNLNMPFKEQVDVLFLSNFLISDRSSEKRKNKVTFLQEVRDALKANGVLAFRVRNKFNPFYSFKLPSVFEEKKSFYQECRKILRKAGFQAIRIFGCYPNHLFPMYTYSLENTKAVRYLSERIVNSRIDLIFFRIISKNICLSRLLSPSFMVFAFKEKTGGRTDFVGDLVIGGSDVYAKYVKVINLNRNIITKVLRKKHFGNYFRKEVKIRNSFYTNAPKLITYDESKGYLVEELIDGENLESIYSKNPHKCLELVPKAFDALMNYYRSQKCSHFTIYEYSVQLLRQLTEYQRKSLLKLYLEGFTGAYKQFIEKNYVKGRSMNNLMESEIPILQIHGDFRFKNIMYSGTNPNIFLIDWDSTRKASIYRDFFNLILCAPFDRDTAKDIINLESRNNIGKVMLDVLYDKYSDWGELNRYFMRALTFICLAEDILHILKLMLDNEVLYEAIEDVKEFEKKARSLNCVV